MLQPPDKGLDKPSSYGYLLLSRAWRDTCPLLGFPAVVLAVLFTAATTIAFGPPVLTLGGILRTVGVAALCYVTAVLLILLWNVVREPAHIYAEQEQKISAHERRRDDQAVLDRLAEFRQALINLEATGDCIKTEADVIPWIQEIDETIRAAGEYLEAQVSRAARNRFDALGRLDALEVFGLEPRHYQHAVMLVHYQRNLEAVMDRFAVETGTSC